MYYFINGAIAGDFLPLAYGQLTRNNKSSDRLKNRLEVRK